MFSRNPFPESYEKKYLRRFHFNYLAKYKASVNHELAYFGLPSTQMLDVELWKSLLSHITAIENKPQKALMMYRYANLLGIRAKTIIIERDLSEICRLLVLDDSIGDLSLSQLTPPERKKIQKAKEINYDVYNLDYCGGFLYPRQDGESDNTNIIEDIIDYQAKRRHPFTLILTFQLRDTGMEHYDNFIVDTLKVLEDMGINVRDVVKFYTDHEIPDQPPHLRRLRFCVPVYIHKKAYEKFQVSIIGTWYYKNFYHISLFFEPRLGINTLGSIWPPIDEFKTLLKDKVVRLESDDQEVIRQIDLLAPFIV